jgi:signal transduction histidine kinase
MRRIDRALMALLVPVWALALLLSFLSIDRNIVESPVRVRGAESPAGYPVISSLQPWAVVVTDASTRPRVGDTIVQVGDVDVRGASAPRTISLVWWAMGDDGAVPMGIERGGRRIDVVGRIPATVPKWPGLIVSLVFGGLAIFGLRRFPTLRVSQIAFPTLMATAIFLGSRFGTTPPELLSAFGLQAASLLFVQPLSVRLIRHFPDGREGALWARGWPWLLGANGPLLVGSILYDVWPAAVSDSGNKLITVVAPLVFLGVGFDRYRASNRMNRRRFKWLLLGVLIASVPGLVVGFASALDPALGWWFLPGQLAQLAIPICLWIAIARHQLFDIDRVLNLAVVLFGVVLALGLATVSFGVVGRDALVSRAGASPETAAVLLVFLAMAVVVPAAAWAHGRLDAWTLRQRRAREAGVAKLLGELSRAEKLEEIGARLTHELVHVWNARSAALFMRIDGAMSPIYREGVLPDDLDLTPSSAMDSVGRSAQAAGDGVLRDVQRPIVARVSGPSDLEGVVVLGPNRSGDVYEESDRALLAIVAERVASVLVLLEQRELLQSARALNRELGEGKAQAEAQSAEKTALLATATHDLRQPLQALRLFLGTLGERVGDDEDRLLVEKAQLSAIAMQQQFEALLDGTRLEAGAVQAQLQTVGLHELFAEIHAFLEPLAEQKGIDLSFDAGGLAVRSDPSLLRSVLQNLVGNAIRFTTEGGVRLLAVEDADGVEIEVVDSGRGMGEAEMQGLFEAGRRGRSATGESQGSGLGLSIVARLCELLGHAIEVRSKRGQGSTVAIRAAAAARSSVGQRGRAFTGGAAISGTRVIVVDDDPETREAVVRLVRSWGADVADGASADEVIASSPGFQPDVALLDYTLAEGTGLDALAALEAVWGALPAAVLTGERDADVVARVRERGLPLLRKPAAPVQIRAVLSSLLGSSGEDGQGA